jgi:hypothetical protein
MVAPIIERRSAGNAWVRKSTARSSISRQWFYGHLVPYLCELISDEEAPNVAGGAHLLEHPNLPEEMAASVMVRPFRPAPGAFISEVRPSA